MGLTQHPTGAGAVCPPAVDPKHLGSGLADPWKGLTGRGISLLAPKHLHLLHNDLNLLFTCL